jgi:hypothetical protein
MSPVNEYVGLFLAAGALGCLMLAVYAALERRRKTREANAWLERYFAMVRADRARRDRWGKFIPQTQRDAEQLRKDHP